MMTKARNTSAGAIGVALLVLLAIIAVAALVWITLPGPGAGVVVDEAKAANRPASTFPAADEDYFREMDSGVALTPEEVKGRNTWNVWTGGNDRFWDTIGVKAVGALDFLKTISSHPNLKFGRDNRWQHLGLVNEPCFVKATGPDPARHNLWLDRRSPDCPPDPFENAQKYPGVAIGARGKNIELGSYYGYATGIVGLRLFPNPDFDERAAREWNGDRFYNDPSYYYSERLVRPYRVGMSCGFCHVGPNPVNPPADPGSPKWENLSSNVGAQYFWTDRIFFWEADQTNFAFQLFHTYRPGTLDTSFISTDNINNPRTMNAVYHLLPRLMQSKRWGQETLSGGGLDNRQFNHFVKDGPLAQFFQEPGTAWTPRVLKDGADSVGALGALNRVYINIGTFSEEWLLHFNALVGGKRVTPITIADSRKNSSYFEATEAQTLDTARFFLKTTGPHHLKDAPGGQTYLTKDNEVLTRGKVAFAENCARCHSTKTVPPPVPGLDPNGCAGKDYLSCWNQYWEWTETQDFKDKMRQIVLAPDFLDDNYLSAEFRVPVTLLQTNACSPLATNALGGNIWDNFSSQSYKDLPSVGQVTWYHPYSGEPRTYTMPAGGRGYTRPPSLISLWSTAPLLLNNTVGPFESSPSVEGRMRSFQASIEQMLWPEKREKDDLLGDKVPGRMDRTTVPSYLRVSRGYLPEFVQRLPSDMLVPKYFSPEGIEIGPIPSGTPVGLLANLNLLFEDPDPTRLDVDALARHQQNVVSLLRRMARDFVELPANFTEDQAREKFRNLVDPLLALSKCPDFVVNRGHLFGTMLPDRDKRALIEVLKTF
jgi:hypothetical protein